MRVLVTGSSGLIGSAAVLHFDGLGHEVVGLDKNLRRAFFGEAGDTGANLRRLNAETRGFRHVELDVRDRPEVEAIFAGRGFDLVVHCAGQPSHDKSYELPLEDFDINAVGAVNLLEAARRSRPDAPFILMSTNKVYGDAPNERPLEESETRYDYARPEDREGVDETCRIDRSFHSVFGASKAAADLIAQEYGRVFGLPVGIFRAGCVTGPMHAGVEMHGFLSHLVKTAARGQPYTIFGYKGKQVRDQLHAADLARAFELFAARPRAGEVYNIGGGRGNSASVLECLRAVEKRLGRPVETRYEDRARRGDHVCYISDVRKFRAHYPEWSMTRPLDAILDEMIEAERRL